MPAVVKNLHARQPDRLFRRASIALLLAFVALLGVAAVAWRIYSTASEELMRSQEARAVVRRALTTLLDAETGQRGWLATGDERFLEPYQRALHDWPEERRALDESVGPLGVDPLQLKLTEELGDRRLAQLGTAKNAPREALANHMVRGRELMDLARAGFAELDASGDREVHRHERVARRASQWISFLLAGAVFTLLLLGGSVVVARRNAEARRKAAAERERLVDRFRVLTLSTSQMVWSTDAHGMVIEDSPSWRGFTGQSYDQWKGTGWLDSLHPDDRAKANAAWRAAVEAKSIYETEYRVRRKDGCWVWTRAVGAPILDGDGNVVEWVGSCTDITTQKSAQEEREAASRAKDEFLAMLGHELRNPMAPIATALQLMKLKGERSTRELEVIERQVGYMLRLVDDLLDISRITKGKIELRKERLALATVVTKAVEMVMPIYEQRQHRLDVKVEPDLWLDADGVRLAQVLSNLLTNAAKYTDPGGSVRFSARREGDEVVVRVADDGIGISPQMLRTVFDPFVQGPRSIDRAQGGMGIGLALVHSLVELHGGTVSAHSEGLEHGSEFVVRLPLASGPSPVAQLTTPAPAEPSAHPHRILIVDDNADAAELMGELLRSAGHDVRLANDAVGAMRVWENFSADLAILDIGLPVMDGYELADRLRAGARKPPRLIAVSGYGQEKDHQRSAEAGFERHLVKPVDPAALFAAIEA